jgi:hypothetical protein
MRLVDTVLSVAIQSATPRTESVHLVDESTRPDLEVQVFEVVSDGVLDDFGRRRGVDHRPVCTAPCTRDLDPERTYYVGGDGLIRSRRFTLRDRGPDVALQIVPRRPALRIGGVILTTVGALTLASSVAVFTLEALFGSTIGAGDEVLAPPDYRPGVALLVTGAGVLAGGITMLVLGRSRLRWARSGLGVVRPLRF